MIDKNDQLDQVSEKIEKIKSRKKKNDNTQKQIRGKADINCNANIYRTHHCSNHWSYSGMVYR